MKYTKAQQKTKEQTISLHNRHRIVAQRMDVSADWSEGMQAGYDAGYTDALEYVKNDLQKQITKIEKFVSECHGSYMHKLEMINVLKAILEKL